MRAVALLKKCGVEFLGTLLLVFAIFATGNFAAIGAALALAVWLGGSISGGAFNPAVAFSLYLTGKLSHIELLSYSIVELLGAATGYYLYRALGPAK